MGLQNKVRCPATLRRETKLGPAGALSDPSHAVSLLDLPEGVLASVLRRLSFVEKCRAQLVCKNFNNVLARPTTGVWGCIPLQHKNIRPVSLSDLTRYNLAFKFGALSSLH